jgi:23S rRNA (uracil1939-C5)-methyltransferase
MRPRRPKFRPNRHGEAPRRGPDAPPRRDGVSASEDPAKLSVVVESLEHDGRGKATRQGKVVLLPQAYPGEGVVFRVDVSTKGALQGRVLKVVRPSKDRVEHPCGHEFHCTGCPLLSYRPEAEARFKRALVARALAELVSDGVDSVKEAETPVGPFGYRHYGKQAFARRDGRVVLGSFVQGTHRVADNRGCPVLAPKLAAIFDRLADLAKRSGLPIHEPGGARGLKHAIARLSRKTGRALLVVADSSDDGAPFEAFLRSFASDLPEATSVFRLAQPGEGNVLLEGACTKIHGDDVVVEEILGKSFRIGPKSFFQVNPAGAEAIFRRAVAFMGEGETALDLYAGAGALSLQLSGAFRKVVAVEASAEAAGHAAENAAMNGCSGVSVRNARIEDVLSALSEEVRPDAIAADPPRRGLGPEVATILAKGPARRIVLLSCDPSSLGRDAKALIAAGRRLVSAVPIDQFPRTGHVEIVSLFE